MNRLTTSIACGSILALFLIYKFLSRNSPRRNSDANERKRSHFFENPLKNECCPKFNPIQPETPCSIPVKVLYGARHAYHGTIHQNTRVKDVVEMLFSNTVPFDQYKVSLLFFGRFVSPELTLSAIKAMCEKETCASPQRLVFHAVAQRRDAVGTETKPSFIFPLWTRYVLCFCAIFSVFFLFILWVQNNLEFVETHLQLEFMLAMAIIFTLLFMTGLLLSILEDIH